MFILLSLISFSVLTPGQSLQNKGNLEVGVGVVDISGENACRSYFEDAERT